MEAGVSSLSEDIVNGDGMGSRLHTRRINSVQLFHMGKDFL